jgi:hypothetical protein
MSGLNARNLNFFNAFARKVRHGKITPTLAEIRKAEEVQDQINQARERIAEAIKRAESERAQEGGARRGTRRGKRAAHRRRTQRRRA